MFHQGQCLEAYKIFGAHLENNNGVKGVRFTVYAPHALSISVVGEFNYWDDAKNVMEKVTMWYLEFIYP